MALNISTGKKERAKKVCIYGVEGVGKTTLASHFPDPLFLDLEDGTSQLDVKRIDDIKEWQNLVDILNEVYKDPTVCRTLVIDTADKLCEMCDTAVCKENKWGSVEDPGYGKGYTVSATKFMGLLRCLDILMDAGINIVLLAHEQLRKIEKPEDLGAYDHWELKVPKKMASLIKEWADLLLFCNFKTEMAVTASGKMKASGNARVMYTDHDAAWDAKNRYDLDRELEMGYENIKHIFEGEKK